MWTAAVSVVVLAAAAWAHGETLIPSSAFGWMIAALLGLGVHALGQGLTSLAMGRTPVPIIALVILAQPPFTALAAWTALGEGMTRMQLVGAAVSWSPCCCRARLWRLPGAASRSENAASMTFMLAIASSIGNSSGRLA